MFPAAHRCCTARKEGYKQRLRTRNDTGQKLGLRIVYWRLFATGQYRPPDRLVIAQHNEINRAYSGQDPNLAKIPKTGPYGFADIVGNPNILFAPVDGIIYDGLIRDVEIESGEISSNDPLNSAVAILGDKLEAGAVNFIIANIPPGLDGTILGQAYLGSNLLVVDAATVGSPSDPGPGGSSYGLGGTGKHELGHAILELEHTWVNVSEGGCAGNEDSFNDIPNSFLPAFYGELFQESNGEWNGRFCNRDYDCRYYKYNNPDGIRSEYITDYYEKGLRRSCFDCNVTTTNCSECFEQGEAMCNMMNYGYDSVALMLTEQQVAHGRAFLLSPENTVLEILPVDDNVVPTDAPPASDGFELPLWAIIIITVAALILFIVIPVAVAVSRKRSKPQK